MSLDWEFNLGVMSVSLINMDKSIIEDKLSEVIDVMKFCVSSLSFFKDYVGNEVRSYSTRMWCKAQ